LLKPYLAFLYAEKERVTGEFREARSLYLDALGAAQEAGYTFLEGHVNECLGELLLKTGQPSARLFFTEAARLYRECRAEIKERRVHDKYPEFFTEEHASSKPLAQQGDAHTSEAQILPALDADYLMKSSLALSSEIQQDVLLQKIMNVTVESSGAQQGYFLTEDEGELFVRAESRVSEKVVTRMAAQKLKEDQDICSAIVRYVFRTGERIVLANACQDGPFKDYPEVQAKQLRSVLCLPVVRQTKRVGVLYLENRLLDGVFAPEKTRMTELLTAQAAISLENARLIDDIRNREKELRLIMDSGPTMIWYIDANLRYVRVNKAWEKWFGRAAEEVQGQTVQDVLGEDIWTVIQPYVAKTLAGEVITYEQEIPLPGSKRRWLRATYTPDRDDSGRVLGFAGHALDIGERKRAEESIRTSLHEKEVLLKEVHHRVKNNLQVISSLVDLQADDISDPAFRAISQDVRDRVRSMALVHEKLYQSENFGRVEFSEYARSLLSYLWRVHRPIAANIQLQFNLDPVKLPVDMAVPGGLILNELASNALKHAFAGRPGGQVSIALRTDSQNHVHLVVSDNGVGLPTGLDWRHARSLGLRLVQMLTDQLHGTAQAQNSDGTQFEITFPLASNAAAASEAVQKEVTP
jgi:PAS domain S-box-containing protein